MSWDEKAEDYAQAHHVYGHRDVATNYHGFRMVVEGARWQREALLEDEVVERAARGIHASHARGWGWTEEMAHVRHEYRDRARAALTAAIEGDE